MLGIFGIRGADLHIYFSWLFFTQFMTMFCGQGKAEIVVYEGSTKLDEFPDIQLFYTRTVRRDGIEGLLVIANPLHACVNISKPPNINTSLNWFVLISGNSCNFETKVFNAKLAGYSVAIIYTFKGRVENSSNQHGHDRFHSDMPAVVIKTEDGVKLKEFYAYSVSMLFRLVIFPNSTFNIMTFLLLFSILAGFFLVIMLGLTIFRFIRQVHTISNGCLSSRHLKQLQTTTFKKGHYCETCAICLEDYKDQDKLRILPCSHGYHTKCIDPWLTNNKSCCPVCKRRVILPGENSNIGSDFEAAETTPLLPAELREGSSAHNYLVL